MKILIDNLNNLGFNVENLKLIEPHKFDNIDKVTLVFLAFKGMLEDDLIEENAVLEEMKIVEHTLLYRERGENEFLALHDIFARLK